MNLFEALRKDGPLCKGIFWINDTDDIGASELFFTIPCDSDGNVIDFDIAFSSKSGDNFNHKNTWNTLDKKLTNNKKYDYYPRGRVEISNGKATIYANPNIANDDLKEWCIDKFNLYDSNGIKKVIIKPDHSKHYKCYLDQ